MRKAAAALRNAPDKNEELTSMDGPESGVVASETPPAFTRFWEVDSWRGVAIITMVIYHLMFDLRNFGGVPGRTA